MSKHRGLDNAPRPVVGVVQITGPEVSGPWRLV
jgi:hypothetical protein